MRDNTMRNSGSTNDTQRITKENAMPESREMTVREAIDHLFTYHAPSIEQQAAYTAIREAAKMLAVVIMENCAGGPDRTAAIRKVREAVMTANASIATNNAASAVR